MGKTIQLLESALQAWEDLFMLYEGRIRVGLKTGIRTREELVGPVRHWRELRNHLLQLKGKDYDLNRFGYRNAGIGLLSGPMFESAMELMGGSVSELNADPWGEVFNRAYEALPLQLASWTISSRRVFHLSDEMVQRFLAADYSNYTWADLLWPFDAFIVELESPLSLPLGRRDPISTIDMLLVSSLYGVCPEHALASEDGFEVLPFFSRFRNCAAAQEFMSEKDRNWFRDAIRHKRWFKLNSRIVPLTMSLGEKLMNGMLPFPPGFTQAVPFEKSKPIEDIAVSKILAGLCLYLEALPPGVVDGYVWQHEENPNAHKCLRKTISSGEYICHVEDFHTLSPDTMSLFPEVLKKGPAHEVSPHWRRAHYRRRPGQGNNPLAPRDVLVQSALIHKDQMPDGVVPGGSVTHVR